MIRMLSAERHSRNHAKYVFPGYISAFRFGDLADEIGILPPVSQYQFPCKAECSRSFIACDHDIASSSLQKDPVKRVRELPDGVLGVEIHLSLAALSVRSGQGHLLHSKLFRECSSALRNEQACVEACALFFIISDLKRLMHFPGIPGLGRAGVIFVHIAVRSFLHAHRRLLRRGVILKSVILVEIPFHLLPLGHDLFEIELSGDLLLRFRVLLYYHRVLAVSFLAQVRVIIFQIPEPFRDRLLHSLL